MMSIFRSGFVQALQVRSLKDIQDGESSIEAGELYDIVLDMPTMYVIRGKDGRDILVPKESFELVDPKANVKPS
ncbi:MAG: hypothetical protein ABIR96_10715 [Bdellovibrionota bacterium]